MSANCPQCGSKISTAAALCPECLKRVALRESPPPHDQADMTAANDLLPDSARGKTGGNGNFSVTARAGGGERFGEYELLESIGEGAMGTVFKARHTRLNRVVALKLIRRGRNASEAERKRFLREAEAVARLQHPHIITLFEAGEADGQPFLAMEFVAGGTLAKTIGEKPLPPRRAAECVRKISEAVHYAHDHGVLHRDLKPSNVVLDQDLEPRVMDFGLARLLEQDSEMTLTGMAMGSPSYMSPEQAAGKVREVGAASDVYALGAMLYETLTARPPFQAESPVETMRQVVEKEAVSPRLLNASVPRDLETICLKCLAKEPRRRYATARELAEDLARFERDEPISARPAGTAEKVWRWCRRSPALSASLVLVLVLVLVLAIGSPIALFRINRERQRAEQHAQGEREQRQAAEEYLSRMRLNLYASDISFVAAALRRGDLGLARQTLAGMRPQPGEEDLRGFEWRHLWDQCQGDQIATLGSHDWIVTCAEFSPDGKLLATGGHDTTVKIWDVQRRELLTTLNAATGAVWTVAFTPDGRFLVTSGGSGTRLWDVNSWQTTRTFPGQTASVSKTSPLIAIAEVPFTSWWQPAGAVSIWNYLTGEKIRQLPKPGRVVAFSADGKTLAASDYRTGIDLWDVASGELQRTLTTSNTTRILVFSPDGNQLVALGGSPTLHDLRTNGVARKLELHPRDTWGASFSPDGSTLATTSSDQTLRLSDAATLQMKASLCGHEQEVWCVAFSPDGQLLATGGKDQKVMLWSGVSRKTEKSVPNQREYPPFFSPDGKLIVTLGTTNSTTSSAVRDLNNGSLVTVPGQRAIGFTADGDKVVRWGRDGRSLEFVSLESTNMTRMVLTGFDEKSRGLEFESFTPDWKIFFAVDGQGRVIVWEVATGKVLQRLQGPPPPISAAQISPGGRYLALGARQENVIRLYDLETGREAQLRSHKAAVRGLSFSPDNAMLASGSLDGKIRLWSTSKGEVLATLPGHAEETSDVAFSPDGRTLASVNLRLSVKLWHIATRRELFSWDFRRAGEKLRFSPDGRFLAVTTSTNAILLFEAPPFRDP